MQLFYSKDITSDGFCTLDAEESRHAVRVLRLREGDELHVTDGRGHLYRCRIVNADDRACTVMSEDSTFNIQHSTLHLAVAPTKNPSRMEWLVEKAVEMGVSEITLLQCDHSERTFLKTDRLEKLAVSAMKQSLHTILPKINPAVNLSDWLHSVFSVQCSVFSDATQANGRQLNTKHSPLNTQRFIAHCESDKPRVPLATVLKPGHDAVVLIGPEGDFSEEEIALAIECGFQPVSFGAARLRTETAAIYAVAAFNLINDR
ncbi:MAG: 16S rRNA (uracil(1498)-N(3))-methyltransferase [Bacteroidales bacterium]|nr:16S rRNA (uracil(1498)-N(3))-methyltransferase [Bacteroidales bacterium]